MRDFITVEDPQQAVWNIGHYRYKGLILHAFLPFVCVDTNYKEERCLPLYKSFTLTYIAIHVGFAIWVLLMLTIAMHHYSLYCHV